MSVGGAGGIRRLLAAKLVTDLSRRLSVLFFGRFLFLMLNGGLKMLRRTLHVRPWQIPFLSGLAFRVSDARALHHRLKCGRGLLYEVGQLMRQQSLTGAGLRSELTGAEHDVPPDRVGERVDRARRLRCSVICVHAHLAQVAAETGLHQRACFTIERLANTRTV